MNTLNKKYLAAFVAVALVAGLGGTLAYGHKPAPAATVSAAQVTSAEVIVRPVQVSDEFTGRLEAVNTVQIRPRVNGYIQAVGFKEGELVHQGQLLFQIDPRPYQAEVDRLAANLAQARAELTLARANGDRARRLLDQNAISREEADRLGTADQSAQAQLAAVAAQLETAKLNLGYTHVTAPIAGRVSNQHVTLGNLVAGTDVLTTVVSVNPIYAYFDVDEQTYLKYSDDQAAGSAAGSAAGPADEHAQSGNVVRVGLANEQGFPHEGRLDFVDNQVSATSGTIRLRAVLDNQDGRYTPGLFARLQLHSGKQYDAALIDDRSVGTDLGNQFVYVIGADNKVEYRKVALGPMVDGLRVVTDGLKAGDVVVVNGLQRVHPGDVVQPSKVAMDQRIDDARRLAEGNNKPATPTAEAADHDDKQNAAKTAAALNHSNNEG